MTLKPSQIHEILNSKRQEFSAFSQETWQQLKQYRAVLARLEPEEAALREQLQELPADIGARLLEPLGESTNGVIPSKLVWQSREQSLSWVRDRLTGITTFAVDGSQIYPGKDLSIPVALVQIGWFENLHLPTGGYEKDIEVDVMTPVDLNVGSGESADGRVNMRRFEMETQKLISYMKANANRTDCLVFLDGSLVVTFADRFDEESRQFYVDCALALVRASEKYRVPLVAYVDTSQADDLTNMLQRLFELPETQSIHDAQILNKYMEWGDRTPFFLCQRHGILERYDNHRHRIAFTYLKTTQENYPARLEMPLWMVEAEIGDRIVDWVRGEVIIGGGYPYVIETADQTAVLKVEDRQVFFRILQDWAEQEELSLRFSRKMVSKVRRR
jgi:NurA domain